MPRSMRVMLAALLSAAALVVLASPGLPAAGPDQASAAAKKKKKKAKRKPALGLPARRSCKRPTTFTFRLRPARRQRLRAVRVYVNGKRQRVRVQQGRRRGRTVGVRTVKGRALRSRIRLVRLSRGPVKVTVIGQTTRRKRVRATRRYRGCGSGPGGELVGAQSGDVPMWQFDPLGSRHNAAERTLTPGNVKDLELKWSFSVPNSDGAQSSQPALVGDTIYVGGRNGIFYALDAKTGKERWSYDTSEVVGPKPPNPGLFPDPSGSTGQNPIRSGAAVVDGTVYFGDFNAFLYALDARTGKLRWATKLDPYQQMIVTGSPLVHDGRVYIGVSSNEVFSSVSPTYPCCRARGSLVSLDARSGRMLWRYYTVGEPKPAGTNSYGAARFEPSGVSVWSSPAINAAGDTVFFGTAQNYTGDSPRADSMVALDAKTGQERWANQLTKGDKWSAQCLFPVPGGNCPEPGPDFDFGSSPNLFRAGGRLLMGQGQKSGVYHALDARTGQIVWQTTLNRASGRGGAGGQEGIQWGSSYDGRRLYVATNQASPGTLFALDPATGRGLWKTANPANGCESGGAAASRPGDCALALPAAVSTTPGVVWEGSRDGKMRAFAADNGRVLWEYDTVQNYVGTNGLPGKGGSISGGGATIGRGMVYVNSGYQTANSAFTGIPGSVVLAFGLKR